MEAIHQAKILTAEETARGLKIGKSTLYGMVKAGKVPCLGIGKTGVRFDWDAVIAALQK